MPDEPQARVSDLYIPDLAKREAEIERLVAVGEPAIVPLVRYLKEYEAKEHFIYLGDSLASIKKETVLEAVQRSLQGIGAPAVAPLIELMHDKHAKLRSHAAKTLNLIGPPAIAPLLDLLNYGDDRARAFAAEALTGIEEERVILALREALNAKSIEVRAAVAGALAGTEDEQTILALRRALVDAVTENRRLRRRRIVTALSIYVVILSAFITICVMFHLKWHFLIQMLIQMSLQMFAGIAALDATASVRKNAVTALGKNADPRMAGAFAVCLNDKRPEIRNAASRALKEVLPKLQASDRQYFAPAEMDGLINALDGKDEALKLAILKALQQIGDDRAVPKVAELTWRGNAAVRRAARECLPFLNARAEEAWQAQTLLRASHVDSVVASDTLLRPVTAHIVTAPEELLRAKM